MHQEQWLEGDTRFDKVSSQNALSVEEQGPRLLPSALCSLYFILGGRLDISTSASSLGQERFEKQYPVWRLGLQVK